MSQLLNCDVRSVDPVAGIRGIGIPPAAIIGDGGIADEVVAREQPPAVGSRQQVGVIEAHARVEIGDDQVGITGRDIPCGLRVDCRRSRRISLQVPLPTGRIQRNR